MELRRLALVLALGAASFLLFVALDRRDPNDHDSYYADPVIPSLEDASTLGAGEGAGGHLGRLISRHCNVCISTCKTWTYILRSETRTRGRSAREERRCNREGLRRG